MPLWPYPTNLKRKILGKDQIVSKLLTMEYNNNTKLKNDNRNTKISCTQQGKIQNVWHSLKKNKKINGHAKRQENKSYNEEISQLVESYLNWHRCYKWAGNDIIYCILCVQYLEVLSRITRQAKERKGSILEGRSTTVFICNVII